MFMAGMKQNEKLNRIIGWIPTVKHTELDPLLKDFEPHLEGVYGCFNPNLGGETWLKWLQLYSLYQVKEISYEELAARFEPFYKENGLKDFMEQQRDWRRGMHNNEQMLAGIRAAALLSSAADAKSHWAKYRSLTASRQVWPEIGHARQVKLVSGELKLPAVGPYEYSQEVLEKVRCKLLARDAGHLASRKIATRETR